MGLFKTFFGRVPKRFSRSVREPGCIRLAPRVASGTIQRARRLVEGGRDVLLLIDSLTSLSRAYHHETPASERPLQGAIDVTALQPPKNIFASARNIEGGASLTILATAANRSSSPLDATIFEEFRGTENLILQLDETAARLRVFPAIDIARSETRQENRLRDPDEIERIRALRRALGTQEPSEAIERLRGRLSRYRTNAEFLLAEAFSF